MFKTINIPEKLLQDKCGIVALSMPRYSKQLSTALLAGVGVQHRGQFGAGVALQTRDGLVEYRASGRLDKIFTPELIKNQHLNQKASWIMVHCRYGTHGGYGHENLQPCITKSSKGIMIAVAHNGQFVIENKKSFKAYSDTFIFARKLAKAQGKNWDAKLLKTLDKFKGSYSLAIGVEEQLYIARDRHGLRPLVLGKYDGGYIAASETKALDKIGAKVIRELNRGEVLKIKKGRLTVLRSGLKSEGNFCDFEWAYFARPDSRFKVNGGWLSLGLSRERAGNIVAKEVSIPNASFVVGVPDSGIALATGYAQATGLPYRQLIVRDHHDPNGLRRTFMQDHEKQRIKDLILGKLSLIADPVMWKNAVVVVCDDSIVRGDVSTKITRAIRDLGAAKIHWISGYPQVRHRCHLGVSMRTREELIASRNNGDVGAIAREIGADSVHYISYSGFIKSRRLSDDITIPRNPKDIFLVNGGCGGCITGKYPISKTGIVWKKTS